MSGCAKAEQSRWGRERIARLGLLAGRGWQAKQIAADPLINSTETNIHQQARRLGVPLRAPVGCITIDLPEVAMHCLNLHAKRRTATPSDLAHQIMMECALDANLIDNIVDYEGGE